MQQIERSLSDDELEVMKKHCEAVRKAREQKGSVAASSAAAGLAAEAGPRPWQPRPLPERDDWSLGEARKMLPNIPGVKLVKDLTRHSRWSAVYPKPPPSHATRAWGPLTGETVHSALACVLARVWQWHHEATGERPAWDFEAAARSGPGLA